MLSHFSHVQLFATPWTVACQAPLSIGFSKQEYWSALPCPPPGYLPDPGIKPISPVSPALQADSLLTEPPGKLPGWLTTSQRVLRLPHRRESPCKWQAPPRWWTQAFWAPCTLRDTCLTQQSSGAFFRLASRSQGFIFLHTQLSKIPIVTTWVPQKPIEASTGFELSGPEFQPYVCHRLAV